MPNLAYPPIAWGDRPGARVATPPGNFSSPVVPQPALMQAFLTPAPFGFTASGTAVNSPYPAAVRMASYRFNYKVGVLSILLSSSLTNYDPTTMGVFVAEDAGPTLSLAGSAGIYLIHSTNQTTAAAPLPSNRTNVLSFGENTALIFDAGRALALYAWSANNASSVVSANAIAYFTTRGI